MIPTDEDLKALRRAEPHPWDGGNKPRTDFRSALAGVLSKYNRQTVSHTPEYVLADYLISCLDSFDNATIERAESFKRGPMQPVECEDPLLIKVPWGPEREGEVPGGSASPDIELTIKAKLVLEFKDGRRVEL